MTPPVHALGHQSMARPAPARRSRGCPPANSHRMNHPHNRDLDGQIWTRLDVYTAQLCRYSIQEPGVGLDSQTHDFVDFFMVFDRFFENISQRR